MTSPQVIFLDVNETLLDLTPLKNTVSKLLEGSQELTKLWFSHLLHYSTVLTLADEYHNFDVIGKATLQMTASGHGIALEEQDAEEALRLIRKLPPHPEVIEALEELKKAGYRLIALTNSPKDVLAEQMTQSGLQALLDEQYSVESLGMFKPHGHVYRWAARQSGAAVADCMMIAAHGWDVAGAMWAGMRALFIARSGKELFPLAGCPEYSAPTFKEAARYLCDLKMN